jgi:hypothetical protein
LFRTQLERMRRQPRNLLSSLPFSLSAPFQASRLRKNSDSSHDLKGCGFQPHRKSCKINPGFSRCGMVQKWNLSFSAACYRVFAPNYANY